MGATRIRPAMPSVFATLALCASALGVPLAAQPPTQAGGDTWRTQIDLGLNSASGNSSLTTLLAGISFRRLANETLEFEVSANYRFGKSEDRTITDLFRTQLKFDVYPQAAWSPFLYGSTERNPVRRVDLRMSGGAGAKYTFWRVPRGRASVSVATILNQEKFKPTGGIAPPTERNTRWSGRAKLNIFFGDGAEFEHITFYQPIWDQFGDFYLILDNSLRVPVFSGLSLVLQHEYRYDQSPVAGIKKSDSFLSVSFRFTF